MARLDRTTVGRVFDALDRLAGELAENSPTLPPNVKKLTGQGDMWRLRIGDYRLLFTRESRIVEAEVTGVVLVHEAGHRREIHQA